MDKRLGAFALAIAAGTPIDIWDRLILDSIQQVLHASDQARYAARMALCEALLNATDEYDRVQKVQ